MEKLSRISREGSGEQYGKKYAMQTSKVVWQILLIILLFLLKSIPKRFMLNCE
jgi:hypothetical protein